MAVIKAKNTAGEWVNVASADATTITNEIIGMLKTAVIPYTTDTLSYDLSPYVKENDEFILFFVCEFDVNTENATPTGANNIYGFNHIGGVASVGVLDSSANWRVESLNDVLGSFNANIQAKYFTWDEATRVLTFIRPLHNHSSMGDKALLLYTGIKEA